MPPPTAPSCGRRPAFGAARGAAMELATSATCPRGRDNGSREGPLARWTARVREHSQHTPKGTQNSPNALKTFQKPPNTFKSALSSWAIRPIFQEVNRHTPHTLPSHLSKCPDAP